MPKSDAKEDEISAGLINLDDIHYDFDPKGDTIIILKDADAEFAPWQNTQPPDLLEPKKPDDSINQVGNSRALQFYNEETEAWKEYKDRETVKCEVEDLGTKSSESPHTPDIHMRVSSKALSLASSYFRKLFEGSWAETANSEGSTKPYVVDAYSWSKQALVIVLDIIHLRTRTVPRELDLETFAKVAVLVDYYGCPEAVEVYVEIWDQNLKGNIPGLYCRDLILRLVIAWVFAMEKDLKAVCVTLLFHLRGPVDTLGLPIPQRLVDFIDEQRQCCVSFVITKLFETMSLMSANINPNSSCDSYTCCSELLGRLTRRMLNHNLISPKPMMPFLGVSWGSLGHCISTIREPTSHIPGHQCSVENYLDPMKETVEADYISSSGKVWEDLPMLMKG